MSRLRSDLDEVLRNIRDAQGHLGIAWGVRNSDGMAEHMMDAMNDLALALEYLGDAIGKVPPDDGTGGEIRDLASALASKRVPQ